MSDYNVNIINQKNAPFNFGDAREKKLNIIGILLQKFILHLQKRKQIQLKFFREGE